MPHRSITHFQPAGMTQPALNILSLISPDFRHPILITHTISRFMINHPRHISSGPSTVFVNGLSLAITGGAVDCGGEVIGSGTVFVGDKAPTQSELISLTGLFDEHFCLTDNWNSQPFEHFAYGIITANSQFEGITNKAGKTKYLRRLYEEDVSLDYIFQTKVGIR
ncbi:hypothetical protein LW347_00290 [Pectobacterium polonicum]|uniref:Uncharacterized protein n=1 Tax=Pectobacterium polonicum TaxID=2485124 RepID=A0AAE9NSQ7_9GAMM|nr:hypothetical protein [Pectobacterium polonicum]UVO08492.1 hypothetical protein LW347_00290 [Pectobacterium polonicum]